MKIIVLAISLAAVLSSCKKQEPPPPPPLTFETDYVSEIFPMSDGTAYVKMGSAGTYFLSGNDALKVRDAAGTPVELSNIKPAGNGTAYATLIGTEGIVVVRGAVAVKIKERSNLR